MRQVSPLAWALLALLAVIWGGSFLAIAVALRELPVLTIVALRVGGGAVALWLVVVLRRIPLPRAPKVWLGIAGMGVLNNIVPFTLITWAQQHVPSGLAAILNAATAIFGVLIAAAVFRDERLTARKGLGVALGFVGVAMAIGIGNLGRLDPGSLGQWALIAAAMSYALSGTWGRLFLGGVPPLVSAAGMLTVAAVVMVPLALSREGLPPAGLSTSVVLAVGYLALVASGVAYLLFYKVLALAGAGNLSLVTLLIAPVAIALGAVVLGESLRPQAYLGFAVLALGLLILDGRLTGRRRD